MTEATTKARRLYYLGAETVYSDKPKGRVCDREGFKALMHPVNLRAGDLLILGSIDVLGTKPKHQTGNLARIEAQGIQAMIVRPEWDGR